MYYVYVCSYRTEPIYNSSVPIQHIALKTSQEQWMREMGGERESQEDPCWWGNMMMMMMKSEHCVVFFTQQGMN